MIPPTVVELEALRAFDTPTICNALEVVAPDRRVVGFTTAPFVCADPGLAPIVGFARTATIRAAAPAPGDAQAQRARRADYYAHVGQGDGPKVMVIEDRDPAPGFGAWWGEVNSTIHKALGCQGAITNGSMRDLDALAPGFQLLAGMLAPSHAHVHVDGFGDPVRVHGMTVSDGDVVHADRHGAVVIPADTVAALPAAVDLIARRERVILDACADSDFDAEVLRRAMAASARID